MKLDKIVEKHTQPVRNEITRQMQVAREILESLRQNSHPEAIVAGGAPRNWRFNRLANDLDIYICAPLYPKELEDILDPHKIQKLGTNVSERYGYSKIEQIKEVRETIFQGIRVQFIVFDTISISHKIFTNNIFQTFDFGICKIAWDDKLGFVETPAFDYDKANKKLTVNMKEVIKFNDPSSLPRRIKKMKNYFPDHELEII